jgi:hypothetical protein
MRLDMLNTVIGNEWAVTGFVRLSRSLGSRHPVAEPYVSYLDALAAVAAVVF